VYRGTLTAMTIHYLLGEAPVHSASRHDVTPYGRVSHLIIAERGTPLRVSRTLCKL